jgi:hypothetical protein
VVAGSLVAQARSMTKYGSVPLERFGQQRSRSVIGGNRFQAILLRSGPQRARRPHIR